MFYNIEPINIEKLLDSLSSRGWTLLAASVSGFGGTILAVIVLLLLVYGIDPAMFDLTPVLAPAAGIAGFVVGGILWWVVIEAGQRTTGIYGGLVGTLTVLFSHFVMWFLIVLLAIATTEDPLSLQLQYDTIANNVFVLGTSSLLLTGVFTLPAGAIVGSELVRLRRSRLEESLSEGVDDDQSE